MAGQDKLKEAVVLALSGDWRRAHAIAQLDTADPLFCWLHACLHKIEGDQANSRYWYIRSGMSFETYADPEAELRAIAAAAA